jgi:hypothetical protein
MPVGPLVASQLSAQVPALRSNVRPLWRRRCPYGLGVCNITCSSGRNRWDPLAIFMPCLMGRMSHFGFEI